jgi:hypothetical protein
VINHRRRWLRGVSRDQPDALNLNAALAVYHRTNDRAKVRREMQQGYYYERELRETEKVLDPDGSPAANGVL